MHFADDGKNLIPAFGIEAGSRLIENQRLGLHGQYTGNGYAAHLTAGKLKRILGSNGFWIQMDHTHCLDNTIMDFIFGEPHVLWPESNIFFHSLFKQLIFRILKNESHPLAQLLSVDLLLMDILSVNKHLAGRRFQQTVQVLDKCRFSTACMSHKSDELAILDIEIDLVQCFVLKNASRRIHMRDID